MITQQAIHANSHYCSTSDRGNLTPGLPQKRNYAKQYVSLSFITSFESDESSIGK